MPRIEDVQKILNAFLGLFTQPFKQDLKAAVTAAATSISLVGFEGLLFLVRGGIRTALEIIGFCLILVLAWMAVTAIVTNVDSRELVIARNLSVVSFWIAVTLVLVFAVEFFSPGPFDRAIRFQRVLYGLLVLVPVHMIRNLPFGTAWWMILVLWFSMGTLAYAVYY